MLDLEKVKTAKLGHILSTDNRVYEIKGTRDGKAGQPTDRLTVMEDLIAQAATALHGYKQDLETALISLRSKLATAQKDQDEAMASLRQHQTGKATALDELNKSQSGKNASLQNGLKEAQDSYNRVLAAVGGRPMRGGNPHIYFVLMALVAIVEWPINRLAFEAAFQEAPAIASIIAFAVGVAIAIIAHFVGTLSRRIEHYGKTFQKRFVILTTIVVLVAFTFFVVYVIALARHEFVKLLAVQNTSAASLFSGDIVGAVTEGFFTPLFTPSDWGLLVINLLVFTVAVAISIAAHDPHPDYAVTHRNRKKAQAAVEKQNATFERLFAGVSKDHDERIRTVQYRTDALSNEISEVETQIKQIDRAMDDALGVVANAVTQSVSAYIQSNRSARGSGVIPACISTPPEPEEVALDLRRRLAV